MKNPDVGIHMLSNGSLNIYFSNLANNDREAAIFMLERALKLAKEVCIKKHDDTREREMVSRARREARQR